MNATVNLSATTTPTLTFQCNYQTETTGAAFYDARFVEISGNNFTTTLLSSQLAGTGQTGGINACSAIGTWHLHTLPLLTSYGTTVKCRFRFDSADSLNNAGAGWAVDDVSFNTTTSSLPGAAVQRLSPDNFQLNDD